MAGTLESNILLQLPKHATESERLAALKFAVYHSSLDDDLARGDLSLDTPIEEYGANLSGGQRQKVALARVFAIRPRILLLDEPTSGLDTESEKIVSDRLGELADVGVVIVSHSARVLALTRRLVVLQDGRILADGLTEKLLHKP
jgi:ABC-type bacteriocin/lantibiotic exporter with double-glycine peptidase domain